VVVLGGRGFFGGAAAGLLRGIGVTPLIASRGAEADVMADAEDADSLRRALRPGDVVLDAAGPFQSRTDTLVRAACEAGFDVVDLADSLSYVEAVQRLSEDAERAGVRVLTACSTVSAVSAAFLALSGIVRPVRYTGALVPATRHSAGGATAASLLGQLGRPVRVFEHGHLVETRGWGAARRIRLPPPAGEVRGRAFETADALTLPAAYPTLRTVATYVDPNAPGLGTMLRIASAAAPLRAFVAAASSVAMPLVRKLGSTRGLVGCEIESDDGRIVRMALTAANRSYLVAVAPAALAVRALATDTFPARGIIPPRQHVDPAELIAFLSTLGIRLIRE
jgi:hypothetical protein